MSAQSKIRTALDLGSQTFEFCLSEWAVEELFVFSPSAFLLEADPA